MKLKQLKCPACGAWHWDWSARADERCARCREAKPATLSEFIGAILGFPRKG